MTANSVLRLLALVGWMLPVAAAEAAPAGTVVLATGQASASSSDTFEMRPLVKDDPVYAREVISSGPNSYVNLRFADGGLTLLRPNSRFLIEDFSHPVIASSEAADPSTPAAAPTAAGSAEPDLRQAPAPGSIQVSTSSPSGGRAFFRLLKGGFRAVSGLIGKSDPAEYRISTPVATIGIRGTDYLVVLCDTVCANDPSIVDALPPGTSGAGGIVIGVIQGGVFVTNEAGQQFELGADQFMVTLPDGSLIQLPVQPHFLRIDPIPNPATICSS